jgi:hypothetical protein
MRSRIIRLFLSNCVFFCVIQGVDIAAFAETDRFLSSFFAANTTSYSGGRGLITLEGISGLFLNPTSGTLNQGDFTGQYCAARLDQGGIEIQHTAMAAYGVTDWFEIGAFGRINEKVERLPSRSTPPGDVAAGGPLLRVRMLREGNWWPEFSVGGLLREGYKTLTRRTLFVAASKGLHLADNGFFRTFRLHGGFREIWQDPRVNVRDAAIGYIGGELQLPQSLFGIGEVSNKGEIFTRIPFAVGVQMRRPGSLGLTLGAVQSGDEKSISLYVGIGFEFR